jgi:hypothetical protein
MRADRLVSLLLLLQVHQSEAEVATLFWPRAVSLLADLGLQEAADSALIEVVEPQELRAQLAQIAATLLLFYQEGRQGDRS